jgi:hypothetical protein
MASRDELSAAVLIGSLAVWGVVHVQLALMVVRQGPRWRGAVALIVPPLAPYWAARSGRWVWAAAWLVAFFTWTVARVLLAR